MGHSNIFHQELFISTNHDNWNFHQEQDFLKKLIAWFLKFEPFYKYKSTERVKSYWPEYVSFVTVCNISKLQIFLKRFNPLI